MCVVGKLDPAHATWAARPSRAVARASVGAQVADQPRSALRRPRTVDGDNGAGVIECGDRPGEAGDDRIEGKRHLRGNRHVARGA